MKETKKKSRPKTPGERLKSLREDKGNLTQEKLAEEIGKIQTSTRTLSTITIGRYENGREPISYKYAVLFAKYFDVYVDWLLYGTGFKNTEEEKKAEQQKIAEHVKSVLDIPQAVMQLMITILRSKGYELTKVPQDLSIDLDAHMYQLTELNGNDDGNTIVFRDDMLFDRILHYADLELSAFLSSALSNGKER